MKTITYKAKKVDGTGWVFGTAITYNEKNYILTEIKDMKNDVIIADECVEVEPDTLELIKIRDQHKSKMMLINERNIEGIVSRVSCVMGFSIDEIRSKSRQEELVAARQVIQYLIFEDMVKCKVYLDFCKIANAVNRHRTSVYHSIQRVNDAIDTNDKMIVSVLKAYNQQKEAA